MKGLLKNLGLLLILAGVATLLICAFTGNVNHNNVLLTAAALIVGGLIAYIAINKRIAD